MTLLIIYTVAAAILVPVGLIGGWFLVRWLWRRKVARRKAKALNHLLGMDDGYNEHQRLDEFEDSIS